MAPYKKPKHKVVVSNPKQPKEEKSKDGFFNLTASFSFGKYDAQMPWSKSTDGKPYVDEVFKSLRGFEGLRWSSIFSAAGGRTRGTNSHNISIA